MPRATKSRTVKANSKTDNASDNVDSTNTQENDTVTSTEEATAPTFDFHVEPAPADYEPERKNPGRTRTPSPFDDTLPEVKDKGWQRVPYTSEEHKAAILRELTKAKQFRGLGMDQNITDTHVEFNVRDLQKRVKKDGNTVTEGEPGYESDSENENASDEARV